MSDASRLTYHRRIRSNRIGEAGTAASFFSLTTRRWTQRALPSVSAKTGSGSDEGVCRMRNPEKTVTKRKAGATARARYLRQNDTEAEYRLWNELRNRRLNGHKFSRQIPLGSYIADFVCREMWLIIELDGSQHAQSETDIIRTTWLNEQGYSVLRFWNGAILRERRVVIDTILAVLDGRIFEKCDIVRFYPAAKLQNEGAEQ